MTTTLSPEDRLREQLWEAYSAGAERTVPDPIEDWDSVREDFDAWYTSLSELWPLEEINLPVRAANAFHRAGLRTVGQVRQSLDPETGKLWDPPVPYALDIRNFGQLTLEQSIRCLAQFDEERQRG